MAAGMNQSELAALLGISQSEVSKHERGERGLDFLQLRTWINTLGLPLEAFVGVFEEGLDRQEAIAAHVQKRAPRASKRARNFNLKSMGH